MRGKQAEQSFVSTQKDFIKFQERKRERQKAQKNWKKETRRTVTTKNSATDWHKIIWF